MWQVGHGKGREGYRLVETSGLGLEEDMLDGVLVLLCCEMVFH